MCSTPRYLPLCLTSNLAVLEWGRCWVLTQEQLNWEYIYLIFMQDICVVWSQILFAQMWIIVNYHAVRMTYGRNCAVLCTYSPSIWKAWELSYGTCYQNYVGRFEIYKARANPYKVFQILRPVNTHITHNSTIILKTLLMFFINLESI